VCPATFVFRTSLGDDVTKEGALPFDMCAPVVTGCRAEPSEVGVSTFEATAKSSETLPKTFE
jgi:hypothetical protein